MPKSENFECLKEDLLLTFGYDACRLEENWGEPGSGASTDLNAITLPAALRLMETRGAKAILYVHELAT